MKITVIGLSHKTAPVSIRDKVMISPENMETALGILKNNEDVKESLILSTCNRTEIFALMPGKCITDTVAVPLFKSLYTDLDIALEEYLYNYSSEAAISHLFRVTSGLDSLALGEPQIFGQVKDAYTSAVRNSNTGPILNRLIHKAFEVTKNIRTNTGIGEGTTSIGFAAVEKTQKLFTDLSKLKVMVVGAGETGELTAKHFYRRGVRNFLIANRTYEKGAVLAESLDGSAIRFNRIGEFLSEVDVVVSCVGADELIVTRDSVADIMKVRKNRQLFFIDLGAPRDIDPNARDIKNVSVFNIDDLKDVIESNFAKRRKHAGEAEKIIEEEKEDFINWYGTINVLPTIQRLQERFDEIRRKEITTNRKKLNGVDPEQIDLLTRSIVKKILKDPILRLKKHAGTQEGITDAEILKRIFKLDDNSRKESSE
ncbi:MAG: glutamyl-tRNA reductase [bacterium]|nr:glutamyl-tRNA reductase [bacterium]